MAPSRKVNNGRSPLVNKQHQITAFFTKSPSPLLKNAHQSSPLNPEKTQFVKPLKNPNPNSSPNSSPPATPSPINAKLKTNLIVKPQLVVGSQKPSADLGESLYGDEVVGRRIRVYWPLDSEWYQGRVKSFDTVSRKHLVDYDDGEEELIDLSREKIEWIEGEGGELGFSGVKRLKRRRLRKASVVLDDDDEGMGEGNVGEGDDDSSDEDWGKNGVVEEEDEDGAEAGNVELEDEEEVGSLKRKKRESGVSGGTKKCKVKDGDGEMVDSNDKKKKTGFVFDGFGSSKLGKPICNVQGN